MEGSPASEKEETSLAYDQIFRLERNLLAASKSKGPFDPAVRRLRTSIRDSYEALILRDLPACESLEVEQALWRLHYREIEGFRLRIRKLLAAKSAAADAADAGERGKKRKKGSRQEPLLRALTSFKGFLGEASGFFHGLLIKLRLQNGLASSIGNMDRLAGEGLTDDLRRCMVICHKIMIYLGDLARYKELYGVMDSSARDWSVAANYYKQAAFLWPASGNPYNQLAVLCTYCGNSLTALYQYCRSLAVSAPFDTAWDNLALLFEKSKQHLDQFPASRFSPSPKSSSETKLPTNLHGFIIEQDLWSTTRAPSSCGSFVMHFVKFVGVLLTQSSASELAEIVDTTSRYLEISLHADSSSTNEKTAHKSADSTPFALQVMVILIFCTHHILLKSSNPKVLDSYLVTSLNFTFKFGSLLMEVAEKSRLSSAFPVAVIFIEWLANQPKAFIIFEKESSVAKSFKGFHEKVLAFDITMMSDFDVGLEGDLCSHVSGKAQWEDHELLGFIPLAPIHLSLDFSNQLPGYGITDASTYLCWKLRYLAALQKFFETCQGGCLVDTHIEGYLEADKHSVERQRMRNTSESTINSTDPGQIALTDEDASNTAGTNPTPSLREWIERTYFSPDVPAALVDAKHHQVLMHCEVNVEVDDNAPGSSSQAALQGSRLEGLLSCSHPSSPERLASRIATSLPAFGELEGKLEAHKLVTEVTINLASPTQTECVSIAGASDINSKGRSGSTCREASSPPIIAGCGSPCSSLVLKHRSIFLSRRKERAPIEQTIVKSQGQQLPINWVTVLDGRMHVSLEGGLSRSAGHDFLAFQSSTPLAYNRMLICTNKTCETQNPFVLRLKKCIADRN